MKILNENLLEVAIPGIYEIQCISNKKVYIGESECLLARFGKHVATLTQNKHDCKELQKDWNTFGIKTFTIKVLYFGKAYASQDTRREKEKSVIKHKLSDSFLLYNTDRAAFFTGNYRREIEIDGKRYKTIAETKKTLPDVPVSETTIRRRLDDPKYPTYKEIQLSFNGYSINGEHFETLNDIVEAGFATNRQTVMRRRNSTHPKWKNWKLSK